MKRFTLAIATAALAVTLGGTAIAGSCENFTAYQERINGIPAHLLTAIAHAESGRYDEASGKVSAWPWTVTSSEGDVKYATKWEAIDAVRELRKRGVGNIDVGCMQINLHYHPDAFSNLNLAFDPARNVAYAAGLLRGHYQRTGDWKLAVAYYHSTDPEKYEPYQAKVEDLWMQARADAAYASWDGDDADFDGDDVRRARLWDAAQAWVDGHPNAHRWVNRSDRTRYGWPWRSHWTWRDRPTWAAEPDGRPWFRRWVSWYGDRPVDGDDRYRILPVEPGHPWRPVGTNRFN
jgi:transglycosylase-like protein with SLT domain